MSGVPIVRELAKSAFAHQARVATELAPAAVCARPFAWSACGKSERWSAVQPCKLYASTKSPAQDLFTGAAALYYLTGLPAYRFDADMFYNQSNPFLFYYQVRYYQSCNCFVPLQI